MKHPEGEEIFLDLHLFRHVGDTIQHHLKKTFGGKKRGTEALFLLFQTGDTQMIMKKRGVRFSRGLGPFHEKDVEFLRRGCWKRLFGF